MQEVISLKNSCRSRLNTQLSPSFSQRSFLISDFISPNFVDSLLLNYDRNSLQEAISDSNSLMGLIDRTQQAFDTIKHQLDALQAKFVQHLTGSYTQSGHSDQLEKLNLLELQMKKCHQKIRHSSLSDMILVDNFASLLNDFECTINKSISHTMEEKATEALKRIESIQTDLQNAVSKIPYNQTDSGLWKLKQPKQWATPVGIPSEAHQTKKLLTLEANIDDYFCSSTMMQVPRHKYSLMAMQELSKLAMIKMIDVDKRRVLFTSKNEGIEIYTSLINFLHFESINMIVSGCGLAQQGNPVIRLSRASSKGALRRVADISIRSLFSEKINGIDVWFSFLKPQQFMIVACKKMFKVINLLTRDIVQTRNFEENIEGIKYIKDLELLILISKSRLLAYELSDGLISRHPKFDDCIKAYKSNGLYLAANAVIFIKHSSNGSRRTTLQDESVVSFIQLRVNQEGVNIYKVIRKTSELYQHLYLNNQDYGENWPNVTIWYVVMNFQLNKLKLLYNVADHTKLYEGEVDFNGCETSAKLVKQDMLPEHSTPVVYNLANDLYIEKFDL